MTSFGGISGILEQEVEKLKTIHHTKLSNQAVERGKVRMISFLSNQEFKKRDISIFSKI